MQKSVILLCPPFSGARYLAEALAQHGWKAGEPLMPNASDPSISSFENELLVNANQDMIREARVQVGWNNDDALNWASAFEPEKVIEPNRLWSDRVLMAFNQAPVLIKEPQLVWSLHQWLPVFWPAGILDQMEDRKPEVVVLFRFPEDFVASCLRFCDTTCPQVPADPEYFRKLWVTCYLTIRSLAKRFGNFHYFQSTDMLTCASGMARLKALLAPDTDLELKPLGSKTIRHRLRRDTTDLPRATWKLYDELYWSATGK